MKNGLLANPAIVDRTYPLNEVPEAMRYLQGGRARGKIIIIP
jgi:hypothetical protein